MRNKFRRPVIYVTEAETRRSKPSSNREEIMSMLIDVIGLLAVLANGLFALHIWAAVSAQAHRPIRAR